MMTLSDVAWTQNTRSYELTESGNHDSIGPGLSALDLTPRRYRSPDLDTLVAAVVGHLGVPVNGYAVAALLESEGWSDDIVRQVFGQANLLMLGELLWRRSWALPSTQEVAEHSQIKPKMSEVSNQHLRGLYLFALAIVQLAGLVVVGVTFGAGSGYTIREATSVGVALLLGLIWSNGFSQLLAREPMGLYMSGKQVLCGRAILRLLSLSLGLALLIALCTLAFAYVFVETMIWPATLATAYFLLLAMFWLLVNALFIIDLAPLTVAATLLALAILVVAQTNGGPTIQVWLPGIGLVVASLFMLTSLIIWWVSRELASNPNERLSSLKAIFVEQWGYIVYGIGIMLLIVLDRLVAWSTGTEGVGIVVRVHYEVALGWALLLFLIMVACQEWLLAVFLRSMRRSIKRYSSADLAAFRTLWYRSYRKRMAVLAAFILLIIVAAATLLGFLAFRVPSLARLMPKGEGLFVWQFGLIGYGLLAIAMLNTGYIISMSKPSLLYRPLVLAIGVDLAVAMTAAWWLGYTGSVLGLIAGAATLLVLTTMQVRKMSLELEQALYAST